MFDSFNYYFKYQAFTFTSEWTIWRAANVSLSDRMEVGSLHAAPSDRNGHIRSQRLRQLH